MKTVLIGLFMALAIPAYAHKPSDSYLKLSLEDSDHSRVSGQWDISLRDLDYAMGLDRNQDNQITWGELKSSHEEIATYALSRLRLHAGQESCVLTVTDQWVDHHTDGGYAVLQFTGRCPETSSALTIDYRLFFDLDPTHRGLLHVEQGGRVQTDILGPEQPSHTITIRSTFGQMLDFLRMGVFHILTGYDHILFLLVLLLPSVLSKMDGEIIGVPRFASAFSNVVKIVTAFTVAHSITLGLAVLHVLSLPSRWVESAIAASIFVAAMNNVRPFIKKRLGLVAFFFGLIHGFGFAGFLNDMALPRETLLRSLLSFNLGIEAGQLGIVALFFPVAFLARRLWFYQRIIFTCGSISIAVFSVILLLERALNLTLMP